MENNEVVARLSNKHLEPPQDGPEEWPVYHHERSCSRRDYLVESCAECDLIRAQEEHDAGCPIAQAAKEGRKSTACFCDNLTKAEKDARAEVEECLRCHNLASACKCGAKAQLV